MRGLENAGGIAVTATEQGSFPRIVIDFVRAGQASRRIAGLSVAGRQLLACTAAGFTRIGIALPHGEALDPAAADDVARLASDGTIIVASRTELVSDGVYLLDPDWLVPAEALAGFARSCGDVLRRGEAILVHRADDANRRDVAVAGDAPIALERPDAAREVLRGCGKALDGPVSRRVNRPISRILSRLLLRIPGIRPMHATAGTALLALLMFLALLSSQWWALPAGGLLYQAASVFDGVDGEMARATARSSRIGAAADSLVDIATNLLFFIGVTVHTARTGDMVLAYAGVLVLAIAIVGHALIGMKALAGGGPLTFDLIKQRFDSAVPTGMARLTRFAVIVTGRDFYALFFSVLAILGLNAAILVILTIAATIWLLVVIAVIAGPRGISA